ncbi:ferredoxin [Mycolicibacterium llatzerense]|uniref:ferredoxin n=1 Tax=Mycolicibacterium llatzerense TaxID=280871 RepID=UPI0008DEA844
MSNSPSLHIDPNTCMAAGYCALAHPDLFSLDELGIVRLSTSEASPDTTSIPLLPNQITAATTAAQNCPSGAIEFLD